MGTSRAISANSASSFRFGEFGARCAGAEIRARELLARGQMLRRGISALLEATGTAEAALRASNWVGRSWMPVLTYHRLAHNRGQHPFDRGVIDATPEEFVWQLEILKRHFTPIGLEELADHLRDGTPIPHNPAMVTFDDGYRECATVALPILRAQRVKATFFVASGYIERRRVFWWDRISYLVRTSTQVRIELSYPERVVLRLDTNREIAVRVLLRVVKSAYALDIERFLDELARAAGVNWDAELERSIADELLMTWDDVRALRAANMDIGSHTRTHRVLQTLRISDLDGELTGSRQDLERELGAPIRGISYPVGLPISSSRELVDAVRRAGYEVGFSAGVGWRSRRAHRLDIGRVLIDPSLGRAGFRALLLHPLLVAR